MGLTICFLPAGNREKYQYIINIMSNGNYPLVPFVVRRPNSAAVIRRNKSVRPKTAQNRNSSVRNPIKKKTVTDSAINDKIENLDSRLTNLEDKIVSIINLIDPQESNEDDFHNAPNPNLQIITPRFDNQSANDTGDSGFSQYFRTAKEHPPMQEQIHDYDKELIDAVIDGALQIVKTIIEEKLASPDIRDEEGHSLPVIAHIKFIETNNLEYNNIIRYLLGSKVKLDPSIRKEYTEFVRRYNKKYRKLGGKTKKLKLKSSKTKTSRRK